MIEDQEGFEKILKEKFESFAGRIKNIKIFNYKDFLSVKHDNQRTYSLSAKTDIEKSFLPFQEKQENNDFKLEKEHFKQIEPLQEEIKTPNLGEILKNMNINFDMAKEKQGIISI